MRVSPHRVDVHDGRFATLSGVSVGHSEGAVMDAYGPQIKPRESFYVEGGKYLFYVPEDRSDRTRVVFETDVSGQIDHIRAGRMPEVEYVEGCA